LREPEPLSLELESLPLELESLPLELESLSLDVESSLERIPPPSMYVSTTFSLTFARSGFSSS
jgi:hypothetical protein